MKVFSKFVSFIKSQWMAEDELEREDNRIAILAIAIMIMLFGFFMVLVVFK